MADFPYLDTARQYCVDDLPGASIPGARLQNILESLRLGRPVTPLSLAFLEREGLHALQRLANDEIPFGDFLETARVEQRLRVEAASAAWLAREDEERARKAAIQEKVERAFVEAEAARVATEKDPRYIAKIKQQALRRRYGIDTYVEPDCFGRLMEILKRVDAGQRLSEEDFVWLSTAGEEYFTEELRAAYHQREAAFFAGEFKKTRDPWAAVNASSHYRKCHRAADADTLLASIDIGKQSSPKLKSALCTTHGGVMRDLSRWSEALQLGEQAHAFMPRDYRPCTLLGAVHIEIGEYGLGQEWYAKAVERGATVDAVDQDLRSIFFRAHAAKQAEMREFLLAQDPNRYSWANSKVRGPLHRQGKAVKRNAGGAAG